jgi:hypothetical protein
MNFQGPDNKQGMPVQKIVIAINKIRNPAFFNILQLDLVMIGQVPGVAASFFFPANDNGALVFAIERPFKNRF